MNEAIKGPVGMDVDSHFSKLTSVLSQFNYVVVAEVWHILRRITILKSSSLNDCVELNLTRGKH